MPAARVTKEVKRYLLCFTDGERRIVTIPEGSKITFGAMQIAKDRFGEHQTGGTCLRIYEGGEGIQLAVFPGIQSFRDLSLRVEELVFPEGKPAWRELDPMDVSKDALKALGGSGKGKKYNPNAEVELSWRD